MENPVEQEEQETSVKRENEVEYVPVLVKCNKEKYPGRDIQINNDVFKVGRGDANNARILDVSISRNHCIIQKTDENWKIIDSSSSGTLLNGTKLIKKVTYPLELNDEVQFGDTKQFVYTLKMCPKEENPEAKRVKLEETLMEKVSAQQKVFEELQEAQMKEMEEKILLKQKQTEELIARLDDVRAQNEAVQGETLEKNNQIKLLEEQISASKDNQNQLQDNLKQLVVSMTEERRQFSEKLAEERRKWQEALDMTKQEKEAFEKNMAEQMNNWKEQQLAAVSNDKEALQKKLEETEKALKEQAAVAEQFRTQSVLLSEMTANKDCYVKVSTVAEGTQLTVMETIDLTNENAPSTSKKGAEVGTKIMTAMDEQFTCSICQELFVMATTLNCTHTFCSHCIRTWRNKQRDCPICRTPITSMNRALVVDNFIDDAVGNLPEEEQQKRLQLLKDRKELETPVVAAPTLRIVHVQRGRVVRRGASRGRSDQQVHNVVLNADVHVPLTPQLQHLVEQSHGPGPRAQAPAQRGHAPAQRGHAPVQRGHPPVQRGHAPVQRAPAPAPAANQSQWGNRIPPRR